MRGVLGNPRNHAGGRHLSLDAAVSQLTRHGCYFPACVNFMTQPNDVFTAPLFWLIYHPHPACAWLSLSPSHMALGMGMACVSCGLSRLCQLLNTPALRLEQKLQRFGW